jgi:hypothetical protein
MEESRNIYQTSVGKPERKRPLGRPRHRWEYNIRIILGKWGGKLNTGLIWLRLEISGGLL